MSESRHGARPAPALAIVIILFAVLPYIPSFDGRPIWDDRQFLFDNPILRRDDGLLSIWTTLEGHDYWPISYTYFFFAIRLFGDDMVPYHLANAVFHALAAVLFWRALVLLGLRWAIVPAVAFAAHPVNVEAVAWMFQAKTLLASVFAMGSTVAFLRYEENGKHVDLAVAFAAFVAAMLSKTSAIMFFAVFLLSSALRNGRPTRRAFQVAIPCGLASIALGGLALHAHRLHYLAGTGVVRDDTLLERLLGAFAALWFYLSKAVFPLSLSFVYPRWNIDAKDPHAWLPMIAAILGAATLVRFRKTWGRGPLFAFGAFALILLPVLGFVDIPFMQFSLVADHWQYPAIAAPLALLAPLAERLERRLSSKPTAIALSICALGLAGITASRATLFVDEITVYRHASEMAPDNFMVRLNLGKALVTARDREGAIREFSKAAELDPRSTDALSNLASALAEKGDPEQAAKRFREALAIDPSHVEANYNLGNLLFRIGKLEESVAHYRTVIDRVPDHVEARANAGAALAQLGKYGEAREHLERAVSLSPKNVELRINLARVLGNLGDLPGAELAAKEAVTIQPSSTRARILAAFLVGKQGRIEEARQLYLEAMLMASPEMRREIEAALGALETSTSPPSP